MTKNFNVSQARRRVHNLASISISLFLRLLSKTAWYCLNSHESFAASMATQPDGLVRLSMYFTRPSQQDARANRKEGMLSICTCIWQYDCSIAFWLNMSFFHLAVPFHHSRGGALSGPSLLIYSFSKDAPIHLQLVGMTFTNTRRSCHCSSCAHSFVDTRQDTFLITSIQHLNHDQPLQPQTNQFNKPITCASSQSSLSPSRPLASLLLKNVARTPLYVHFPVPCSASPNSTVHRRLQSSHSTRKPLLMPARKPTKAHSLR